jgi:hypothetical protein
MTIGVEPDADHEAVYAAERAAFDGTDLETVVSLDRLVALAGRLTDGRWWPSGPVTVLASRSDARSSTTRCRVVEAGSTHEIRLATPQMTIATLCHELAHALAGVAAGHGTIFRAAYLDVVGALTNLDPTDRRRELHVSQLADAFAAAALPIAARDWPAPPPTGAIAL